MYDRNKSSHISGGNAALSHLQTRSKYVQMNSFASCPNEDQLKSVYDLIVILVVFMNLTIHYAMNHFS